MTGRNVRSVSSGSRATKSNGRGRKSASAEVRRIGRPQRNLEGQVDEVVLTRRVAHRGVLSVRGYDEVIPNRVEVVHGVQITAGDRQLDRVGAGPQWQ